MKLKRVVEYSGLMLSSECEWWRDGVQIFQQHSIFSNTPQNAMRAEHSVGIRPAWYA